MNIDRLPTALRYSAVKQQLVKSEGTAEFFDLVRDMLKRGDEVSDQICQRVFRSEFAAHKNVNTGHEHRW